MGETTIGLIEPRHVRVNANHLKNVDDDTLISVIEDVHVGFIAPYVSRLQSSALKYQQLALVEKLLAQHMATINIRRADSESIAGMSKSVSVTKGMDLEQTEYGQMAKKLAKELGLDWAYDRKANLVIY